MDAAFRIHANRFQTLSARDKGRSANTGNTTDATGLTMSNAGTWSIVQADCRMASSTATNWRDAIHVVWSNGRET
jgi:hypothetical protein